VLNFIEDSPRLMYFSQLTIFIFPNFLFLEGRDIVAVSFTKIINISRFPIPVILTGYVFLYAGELSAG
jgi:hypothetical protein